jgi:hypothetical protein
MDAAFRPRFEVVSNYSNYTMAQMSPQRAELMDLEQVRIPPICAAVTAEAWINGTSSWANIPFDLRLFPKMQRPGSWFLLTNHGRKSVDRGSLAAQA